MKEFASMQKCSALFVLGNTLRSRNLHPLQTFFDASSVICVCYLYEMYCLLGFSPQIARFVVFYLLYMYYLNPFLLSSELEQKRKIPYGGFILLLECCAFLSRLSPSHFAQLDLEWLAKLIGQMAHPSLAAVRF